MKIFGFEISRVKDLRGVSSVANYGGGGGFFGGVLESFAGAWQKNIVAEPRQNLLAFSAVYSCIRLISEDVGKLRIKLMERDDTNGIWTEVEGNVSPFLGVLRKPNAYQTRIQFLVQWITSKLLYGNTYVYLERRDLRGLVTAMHILDARRVKPLVADDGSVYYELSADYLSGIAQNVTIPASEIIHDRCITLFHPLVGVSPIYACGSSATQGMRIQANSAKFFENMSRPSGVLTAPGTITDETANRFKSEFEKNFSGGNIGRLLVAGDGLKYEPMTIPAADSQLIEQLKWTVEDVARCFGVPLHKLGGSDNPKFTNFGALNQDYYSQTLQIYIESLELLLDEGLGLVDVPSQNYGTELDLSGILRMDPSGRADTTAKLIGAAVISPNEGRALENLLPVEGGDSPMIQQQNFSLAALAKRDAKADPFVTATPPAAPALPAPVPAAPSQDNSKGFDDFMRQVLEEYPEALNA